MNIPAAVLSAPKVSSSQPACPLNDGLAVLDQLLAALTRVGDSAGLDLALDYRLLLAGATEAQTEIVLRDFFRLRGQLGEQHYLLCYRLRRWLESQFVAWVTLDRTQPVRRVALWLDVDSVSQLCTRCSALAADRLASPDWARVRFAQSDRAAELD